MIELAAAEKERVVRGDPLGSGMSAGTLQELVSAAASVHRDRAAVTYDSGSVSASPVTLRYADLIDLTTELSRVLRDNCPDRNGVIGLYCSDDLFIPVWILGILQSPAAYVPLDPEAPGLLSARVMNRCGLKFCAVSTDLLQRFQTAVHEHMSVTVRVVLPKFKLTLVRVMLLPVAEQRPVTGLKDGAGLCDDDSGHRDLAYVLHTSGTTGLPKVVRVPHKCILPNILHLRSLFQMSADDVVFLASPLTFDPSVVDIFLALSSGAQLLIIPSMIKKMPKRLSQLLFEDHKTTVLQVTPTLLCRFGHRTLKRDVLSSGSSLRVLALGGEACPAPALLRSWRHEDNETRVFNIYGITEVSCWACCYEVPPSLLQSDGRPSSPVASTVPLGPPLMDTAVEVRDEHGHVVTEGEGQVFIGGEDRVCLLDDEEAVVPGTMRATGDWVRVEDTQLFYLGRRDRLIKRHGKRVNLDAVQQLVVSLPQVEACAVALYRGVRLLAFVVASASGDQGAAAPLPRADPPGETPASSADGDLSRRILKRLSALLPSHSVPDALVPVAALCPTPHGKVDTEALVRIYEGRRRRCSESTWGDVGELKRALQSMWKDTLGFAADESIDEGSNFLLSGGDSLKALRLCEDVLSAAAGGVTSPELLEVVLDGTFSDVLRYVAGLTLVEPAPLPLENGTSSIREARRRRHADAPSVVPAKREREESPSTAAERLQGLKRTFKVIRRAGEVMEINVSKEDAGSNSRADAVGGEDLSEKRRADVLGLCLSWSSDTGRCVDASPVLLVHEGTGQRSDVGGATVFIGSHSHRVQALDLHSGGLLWERVLGDRIEAAAGVSRCGMLVIIGCYDGGIYFLCAASGATRWTFQTGDAVKSCPAVDPHTGLVMVGSHDGHVYALNPELRQCVWKRHCGGGAVFSSPYLQPDIRRLYVASLGGHLLCLNPDTGDVLWSERRDVPFFSSPSGSSGLVAIGSVDGNICCFSSATGKLMWRFLTNGPVFSSPCVTPDQRRLLCGSHDGHLYCLNRADGSLVWTFRAAGKVYSTPCVFDGATVGRTGPLVGLASTDGTVWILDGDSGRTLASHTLPGELFSSPVVHQRSLVVGCRNDYVYCLKLTVDEEAQRD